MIRREEGRSTFLRMACVYDCVMPRLRTLATSTRALLLARDRVLAAPSRLPRGSKSLGTAFGWLLVLVLALATQARADLISNGNFASVTPALSTNGICTTDPTVYPYKTCSAAGWTGNYQIGNGRTIGIGGSSFTIPQPDPGGSSDALILQTYFNHVSPTATQSITIPTNGLYTLTFYVANRSTSGYRGPQTVTVLIDGVAITGGTYSNLPAAWTFETVNFTITAGNHSLTLAGLTTNSKDVSAFVDDVSLTAGVLPTISAGGVVSAGAFGGFTSAAPGSWIEIYGSNLASDTRGWQSFDFSGVNAPTSLDGTKVTIGGLPAFIDYISPEQVNAQIPSNVGTGLQQMTVSNSVGTSNPFGITINSLEPGLLAPSTFNIGGIQYAAALFSDGSYALPAGAIAGVNSLPAKPGETIILYGVGFGAVTPDIPAGQIVQQSNTLASSFRVSIGGMPATVNYAGLAPNYVGLYQFNIVVPSVAAGDAVQLIFTLDGASGAQTLYIAVGN